MLLKEYLKNNRIRVSGISRASGIPYSTISDIVNGKTDPDNISVKVFRSLSGALGLGMEEFYRMAKETSPTPELGEGYRIRLRNGAYYITISGTEGYLCRNTPLHARYIKNIAETYIFNRKSRERMGTWKTMLKATSL